PCIVVPLSVHTPLILRFPPARFAAPPPPPAAATAAIATVAAALTPHFSSSCLTNPAISRTVSPLSCSTILSVSAILFLRFAASESLRKIKADSHRLGQFSFLFFFCSHGSMSRARVSQRRGYKFSYAL